MAHTVGQLKLWIERLPGTHRDHRDFRKVIVVIVDLYMAIKGRDFFPDLVAEAHPGGQGD